MVFFEFVIGFLTYRARPGLPTKNKKRNYKKPQNSAKKYPLNKIQIQKKIEKNVDRSKEG